jgi:UDP-N-acetylmuramoylalanine--D-glutamate ligase
LVLLLGGADKDLPWDEAVHLAMQKSRHVILFGKTGEKQVRDKAAKLFKLRGADERFMHIVDDLEAAVKKAVELAQEGDVVLLSPGGTSYDAYKDFAERGEHFRQLVNALD